MKNQMNLEFDSYSGNESFARMTVSAFLCHLNPTMEEMADIKTAVSEAVTNSIIHGYGDKIGKIRISCVTDGNDIEVEIADQGVGIDSIELAMEPMYTTRPDLERSGMGFAFMEAFMDSLSVESAPGEGCVVKMTKKVGVPQNDRYHCFD